MILSGKTREQVASEKEEKRLKDIENNRRMAYQLESDPLFFKYQRGEIDKEVWLSKVEEIKARFPKEG